MDAVEFIKATDRICKYYANCSDCPLSMYNNGTNLLCDAYVKDNPEIAVNKIEMWSKEHHRKTMRQVFMEKYPNAKLGDDKTPLNICPTDLGYTIYKTCGNSGFCDSRTCEECWNRPMED